MSRIGRLPIAIPADVQVELNNNHVKVKGPKGELEFSFSSQVAISQDAGQLQVARNSDDKLARALHGTTRAVLSNMVTGVSTGFVKSLEIQGVGYKADMDEKVLVINAGYSHPVNVEPPAGIEFEVTEKNRLILIKGSNKELVGQVAADIRKIRPPEPYKGKGIRYVGEHVRHKAGKSATGAA